MAAEVLPILKPRCKRAPDGTLEIPILGDIGDDGYYGGASTSMEWILQELVWFKPERVKFIIFSPGGYVYDAIAVVGYLKAHGIESWSEIYGYAYSAATVFSAHSGPARTAMASGTMIGIHDAAGGDEQMREEANVFLVDLYSSAYGWSKAQTIKYMQADAPRGTMWSAKEAKKEGICTEIMDGAKVAAQLNLNPTAMADTKKTLKVQAKVKLGTIEAARAAFGDGTTAEVEVDLDQATADALAEKDTRIAQLEAENAELKNKADEAAGQEALTQAKTELDAVKADLATATSNVTAKEAEIARIQAAHAAEIEALKKPLAERTKADNQAPAVGAMPGAKTSAADEGARAFASGLNTLERELIAKPAK